VVRCLAAAAVLSASGVAVGSAYDDIVTHEWQRGRRPLAAIEEEIRRATTPSAQRAVEVNLLRALVNPRATYECKQFVCRMLRRMGSRASVPALARLLFDEKLSHMARFALQHLPGPEAGEALRKAMGRLTGKLKIGAITSLAQRRDRAVASELAALVSGEDKDLAASAVAALGRIGGAEAAEALAGVLAKPSGALRLAAADSYLLCAEGFLDEGYYAEAEAIYKKLYKPSEAKPIRVAAFQGLAAVKAKKASGPPARTMKRTAKKSAADAGPAVAAKAGSVEAWDAKLRDRIKRTLKAGKKLKFYSKKLRMKATVTKVAPSGGLWISATGGMQLGLAWSRLTLLDKKSLALAAAGDDAEGHAVAAFYLLALGEKQGAASHLRRAGDAAKEVREAFK